MAQDGDTITYTYSDGTVVSEDVSGINTVIVDYCDGSGGSNDSSNTGGSGGRVENAEIDVSAIDTLYIWVGAPFDSTDSPGTDGRYGGGTNSGGGSTEIAQTNTAQQDGADEPFLVGAGGGGGAGGTFFPGLGGGRGTLGRSEGFGVAPPLGGGRSQGDGDDAEGAIDDQNRGLVSGGTTITGGGSSGGTAGEVQLSFQSSGGGLSPPDAPTNLSATQQ